MITLPFRRAAQHCDGVQAARAYMVHLPEDTRKVIVLSEDRETVTLEALLVHPISKHIYAQATLELFSPVYLVRSGTLCWYFIVDRNGCSCRQPDCTHVETSKMSKRTFCAR